MKLKAVAVYCASSEGLALRHYELADRLGTQLAERGFQLVYGGGRAGMMGILAEAVRRGGGRVVGVIPDFMVERELANEAADELVVTPTMRERRRLMEERADAFVALPGGFGTLEELVEVMVGRMLNRHAKPIVLVNHDGFYDQLMEFFDRLVADGFKPGGWRELVRVVKEVDEVWRALAEAGDGCGAVDPLWR